MTALHAMVHEPRGPFAVPHTPDANMVAGGAVFAKVMGQQLALLKGRNKSASHN